MKRILIYADTKFEKDENGFIKVDPKDTEKVIGLSKKLAGELKAKLDNVGRVYDSHGNIGLYPKNEGSFGEKDLQTARNIIKKYISEIEKTSFKKFNVVIGSALILFSAEPSDKKILSLGQFTRL